MNEINPYESPLGVTYTPFVWPEWMILLIWIVFLPVCCFWDLLRFRKPSFSACLIYVIGCVCWSADVWLVQSLIRPLLP